MATTNLNVRVDENIKKNAEELLEDLGMNLSTAINVFLRQLIRANGFPFEIKADRPNPETLAVMDDVKNGRNIQGTFDTVEELMEVLNAED